MEKTTYDACRYSYAVVLVVGILGNILVILSILRQKKVLKNNYYFLVLHLAICDLGPLIIFLFNHINRYFVEDRLVTFSSKYCVFFRIYFVFRVAGIGMMLIISLLRYRATVHPLKPAVSRRKLKVVCGLVYIVGFIAGYATYLPLCFMQRTSDVAIVYYKVHNGYAISCFYFFPTIFMAVVYYKISRELIKQNKHMKSICSNPVRRNAPGFSFNFLKFIRNRRTFLVCLITVLCYGIGNIPMTVYLILNIAEQHHLLTKYVWLFYLARVLRVVGSYSVNPLIYGILDKRLLTFWKLCRKKKQRPQGNWLDSSCSKLDKRNIFIDCQPHRQTIVLPGWDFMYLLHRVRQITENRKYRICHMTCEGTYLDLALNKHDSKNAWILLLTRN
jgi:hypothetical protein